MAVRHVTRECESVRADVVWRTGDPNHVTIAGESAGGGDVLLQMLMPGAFSLYERARLTSHELTRSLTHTNDCSYGAAIAESPATPIASTIADALKTTDIVAAKCVVESRAPSRKLHLPDPRVRLVGSAAP